MNTLLNHLISQYKKIKHRKGNEFKNFLTFSHLYLTNEKDDKYKEAKVNVLKYIVAHEKEIKLKLLKN
tara:strand:- start:239 stop:442 length:204 start_codon:yes stop_codon:yes gene_type:complete